MDVINRIFNSFVFWSAWIIIPFIMEIIPAIGSILVLAKRRAHPLKDEKPAIYPEISVIIPVYNSRDTLEACIRSIYDSDYPNDRIRVFLVNNKSKDDSFQVFSVCQEKYPELIMQWLNAEQGKSRALNLALYNSGGKYIIHIDSDGLLEPSALRHMVERFETDVTVNCMTGAICTNPAMIEEYPHGFSRFFRKLEFLEYAQAFLAGRNYASEKNAIYTLSGAFSGFRKSAILKSWLYSTETICEDTQITFQMKYLQEEEVKICEKAIFFVDPIENADKLYTQRQRWQRGSLEVTRMFLRFGFSPFKILKDVNVRTLMYDHTFAFPRLIWYLALICLLFMGFSGKVIGMSMGAIFAMYIVCGYFYYFAIIGFLKEYDELVKYYKKQWWVIPFLPFFNLFVFFIRMAGIINSIEADSAWKTRTFTEEMEAFRQKVKDDFQVVTAKIDKVRRLVNDDEEQKEQRIGKGIGWHIGFDLLYTVAAVLAVIVNWVDAKFGVGANELINTILSPLKGTGSDVVVKALIYCVPRALLLLAPVYVLSVYSCIKLKKMEKQAAVAGKTQQEVIRKDSRKYCTMEWVLAAVSAVVFCLSLFYTEWTFDLLNYFKTSTVSTQLYEQYYISPDEAVITLEGERKNLIYIYLESMETTYASAREGGRQPINYIPELTALAKENVSFSDKDTGLLGGFHSGTGTGWTIASLFATTTGVPYALSASDNSEDAGRPFASGITSLGDFLARQGYVQEFLCGSDATFGGRRNYFTQHGKYKIFDLYTAREKRYIADDYFAWWGFEDKILFEIAKDELLRLSSGTRPFNLTLLTVDTHHFDGYVCDACGSEYPVQTANVVACTDRLVGEFIRWCQKQDFYKDTVIVIVGDHPRMDTPLVEKIPYFDRTIYNCFINAAVDTSNLNTQNRVFTAMDMFPTTLAVMGYQIGGNRLGLGTNLFSNEKTIAEMKGFDWLNEEVSKRSDYYIEHFTPEDGT